MRRSWVRFAPSAELFSFSFLPTFLNNKNVDYLKSGPSERRISTLKKCNPSNAAFGKKDLKSTEWGKIMKGQVIPDIRGWVLPKIPSVGLKSIFVYIRTSKIKGSLAVKKRNVL